MSATGFIDMDLWNKTLLAVQENVGKQCFDTWFRPVSYCGIKNNMLYLTVPTDIFKKCLRKNYATLILDTICNIARISRDSLNLEITVTSFDTPSYIESCEKDSLGLYSDSFDCQDQAAATDLESEDSSSMLNSKYTFDNFVVGSSNEFAHAAAMAVAENPAKTYNPLYLYGGAGLGKTHLMHAIGNHIKSRNSRIRLSYLTFEQFMNDFIIAVRDKDKGQMFKFRRKYRNIDVLLADDIQFMAGKDMTQVEFFHTFNALYDARKQIVITSDCPPKQISALEERFHSRLEWGLIADIQPPDFETKLAIIRKKSQADLFELRDEVAQFIASGIRSNIRELEGALNRLSARSSLNGVDARDIDIPYTKEVLKGIIKDETAGLSPDSIVNAVASFFALKPAQLRAKSNARSIAMPRQIAMYICKELTNQSLPQIGKEFGGKHHTTVLHSVRKIDTLKKKDPDVSDAVKKIVNSLR